jgi:small ligand-binding sensory domain FIST
VPFAAALSQHPLPTHAVGEVVGQVLESIGDAPDAAIVFVTAPFAGAMEDIAATIRATLRPGALIGATASSVLAGTTEVEGEAAISLFAMRLGPKRRHASAGVARAVTFRSDREDDGWAVTTDADLAQRGATLILLADPFSFPVEAVVDDVTGREPTLTVVGGLASAATGPGGNRLVADDVVLAGGAVGLLLPPGLGTRSVVSQGCRPVGEPLVVTKASGAMIDEIAGVPALDRLLLQADAATPGDRRRMNDGLHIGIVLDERKHTFERGDFLIRAVLGADRDRGAVAVGAEVAVGSTVQFQVRDAETADEDLRVLLADAEGAGALVFTCTGRGTSLFDEPNHDATVVSEQLETSAVAGMFCAGEIGPVHGRHVVHAMTASVLLFDDPA